MSISKGLRLLLIGIVAAITLSAAAGTANATRLSLADADGLAAAAGVLTLTASGVTTTCNLTLGLSLVRSTTKTVGATIGTILASGAGSATGGCSSLITRVTILSGIALRYASFSGALPTISSLGTVASAAGFLVDYNSTIIGDCLYSGAVNATFVRNTTTGAVTSVNVSGSNLSNIALTGACPRPAVLSGNLTVVAPQPVVTLI